MDKIHPGYNPIVIRGEAEELARYAAKIRGVERVRKGLGRPIGGSKIGPWGRFFLFVVVFFYVFLAMRFVLLSCFT